MAYNNNSQNVTEPTYYSRFKIKNSTDNLSLNFTFWNGLLGISIVDNSQTDNSKRNSGEIIKISLSPMKARLFSECVARVLKEPEGLDVFGIDTGAGENKGFIAIGRDMGTPYVVIARLNKNGGYEQSQRFRFNQDYNYILKVRDINRCSTQREYLNQSELEAFKDTIDEYVRSINGAAGYAVADVARYETKKLMSLVSGMAEKSGVGNGSSYRSNNGGNYNNGNNRGSSGSFYDNSNKNNGNQSSHRSSNYEAVDSLEDELYDN